MLFSSVGNVQYKFKNQSLNDFLMGSNEAITCTFVPTGALGQLGIRIMQKEMRRVGALQNNDL